MLSSFGRGRLAMRDKAADVHHETVCLRFIKTGCAAQRSGVHGGWWMVLWWWDDGSWCERSDNDACTCSTSDETPSLFAFREHIRLRNLMLFWLVKMIWSRKTVTPVTLHSAAGTSAPPLCITCHVSHLAQKDGPAALASFMLCAATRSALAARVAGCSLHRTAVWR